MCVFPSMGVVDVVAFIDEDADAYVVDHVIHLFAVNG